MIIDLSRLNEKVNRRLQKNGFKIDSAFSFKIEEETIKSIIESNDYLVSIDLKDAFYSVALHEGSKILTCFEIDGIRYCYNVLPFGLTSSLWFFFFKNFETCYILPRTAGVKITAYLDMFKFI